ncbi:2-amino-4-hydroxy-6-hydroxymethyldihydropteridine diphosphokinase [Candidatus Poribacteria bacterium]|nr:2-amino-4-hydroxy-6-hydroxymethyldihydropteridine diphosphokinase [Candidatus Poribacteria bacterium]
MSLAYVSFGSNLGNKLQNINRGLQLVSRNPSITITKKSSLYETEPVGYENQGWFLNGVIEIETNVSPHKLLSLLKKVERIMGRKRRIRWGPREIDFDILLYNQRCIDTPGLIIPHPRMHERGFVLAPLVEIAPQVIHPILKKSAQQLLAELADSKSVKVFGRIGENEKHNNWHSRSR